MCLEVVLYFFIFFFFSSRRRHTRFDCDWSSDVCSSDLSISPSCCSSLRSVANFAAEAATPESAADRKSTRLNSSHSQISYAVFCLKKKKACTHATHPSTAHRLEVLNS